MEALLLVLLVASGNADPVADFMKLDKHMHCLGPPVKPYMVYERNLGYAKRRPAILQNGQKVGLTQVETVAIYGWSLAEYEYINPIAWGAAKANLWIYPAHKYTCSLSKAEVWPEIEVLNAAMKKLPPAQPVGATLWRGSGQSAKQLGSVITGGYSSTSRSFDEAFGFVKRKGGSLWAVESHTSGKDISKFSEAGQPGVSQEDEVLFPAGSRLGVVQCSSSTINAEKQQEINSARGDLAREGKTIDIICLKELPALSLNELFAAVGEKHKPQPPKLPTGVIFDNATEIEQELKRNAQLEQEWKEGNYISDMSVSHSMTNCDQECDEWCWATSATMCASAFGASGSCNSNEEKVAGNRLGSQCDSRCSGGCDKAGSPSNIIDGIKLLSGHSYIVGGVLSQSQLDVALRHGPVVMLVKWNGVGGHAVTLSGGSNGNYKGHDPEGYPINTNYGGLTSYRPSYGGRGKWVQSVYTNIGGDGPSPGPSPGPAPGPSPSGCTDTPQNWQSSEGDSCSTYVSYQYCTPAGREGSGWNRQQWGPITGYADRQGRSAFDACCGCGGGGSRSVIV